MIHRLLAVLGLAAAIAAQTPPPKAKPTSTAARAAKPWTVPRTPDGQPDLQGIWTNASLTPFERPAQFAGKEFFTEEEAAEFARRVNDQSNRDRRGATAEADVAGALQRGIVRSWNQGRVKPAHVDCRGPRGRKDASPDTGGARGGGGAGGGSRAQACGAARFRFASPLHLVAYGRPSDGSRAL